MLNALFQNKMGLIQFVGSSASREVQMFVNYDACMASVLYSSCLSVALSGLMVRASYSFGYRNPNLYW